MEHEHAGKQADPASVHRLQTNEKPRDKMHIHLGCSTTHGRAKFVPSDFHLFGFFEDENAGKRTRNFLTFSSGHKEELKLSLPTTKAN